MRCTEILQNTLIMEVNDFTASEIVDGESATLDTESLASDKLPTSFQMRWLVLF